MARKSFLTPEEIREIKSKPFEIWPECRCKYCELNDFKRGPTPDQSKVFEIPHKHSYDICLAYGGRRGAKTRVAIAKGVWYALAHPGCTILVGAKTLDLLTRTAYKYWKEMFSIKSAWDHPLVARAPSSDLGQNKCLELTNGTQIYFLYFNEFEILRGIGITFAHIEEGSLLDSPDSMEELTRSLSETLAVQNQLIITTNPEEGFSWIYDTFSLEQFKPGYNGPPIPIGKLCTCQYCARCLADDIQVEWVKGKDPKGRDALICPRCPTQYEKDDLGNNLLKDGKPIPRFCMKEDNCPGNQEYYRVVFFDPARNPHVKQAYRELSRQVTDEAKFNLYTKGLVTELRQGFAYSHFARDNVYEKNKPVDYSKDLIWSFDFNIARQCSVICQEVETPGGTIVEVLDEIVLPNCGPTEIAKEFLFRYPTFNKNILIYGDPAALNNKTEYNEISQFQKIVDIITNPKEHLTKEELDSLPDLIPKTVASIPKKKKGQTKIGVYLKIDSLNYKLLDSNGERTLFINPKCKWLTLSLQSMRWKETTGRPGLDVACDKADAKRTNKEKVGLVSHISDSLGYYIAKKWPVIKSTDNAFAVVPGDRSIEVIGNKLVENVEKKEEVVSIREQLAEVDVAPGSILELLHDTGYFDSTEDTFIGYFG